MTTAQRVWLKVGIVASGLVALAVLGLVGLAVVRRDGCGDDVMAHPPS